MPFHKTLIVFILALFFSFFAIIIETQISKYTILHLYSDELSIVAGFLFFSVSFTEEWIKIMPVLIGVYGGAYFEEEYDGIYYTVTAALGVAFLENLIYFYSDGIRTVLPRTFLSLPTHVITAVYSGYFIGLAGIEKTIFMKIIKIFIGLFIAMTIHFLYNFIFSQEILPPYYTAIVFLLITGVSSYLLIKKIIKNSPYRPRKELL